MSIVNRIGRLFKADMHSILDSIEDPQSMLSQALRDMQDCIAHDEARLREITAQRTDAEKKAGEIANVRKDAEAKIELCIKGGNDTLARSVIRKKLECTRFEEALKQRATALSQEQQNVATLLQKRREKFEELKEKAALFRSMPVADAADEPGASNRITESDVEIALLAERERIFGSPAQTPSK